MNRPASSYADAELEVLLNQILAGQVPENYTFELGERVRDFQARQHKDFQDQYEKQKRANDEQHAQWYDKRFPGRPNPFRT